MDKRKNNKKRKWILRSLLCSIAALLIGGGVWVFRSETKLPEEIQASTVVTTRDFRLTVNHKWDNTAKRNYADIKWDEVPELTQSGYKLYQSEDSGNTWSTQSLSYGKAIKVLNVYPDIEESNTLKTWMDGLGLKADDNTNLLQVTPVTITNYNSDPDSYLKDTEGNYQYDVIMFGSWDANNHKDISQLAAEATVDFISAGRGVLFGHDTVRSLSGWKNWWKYFHDDNDYLGIGLDGVTGPYASGSQKVKIVNDGYLMKYPFEMEDEMELEIPYTHHGELSNKSIGTVWVEFIEPSGNWSNPIYEDETWRGGWYLKTNNNVGMIQTGHSQGKSTVDEQKMIANFLYNLAQVSLDNFADAYSVTDNKAPDEPTLDVRCGDRNNLNIRVDTQDNGKIYQWYVEADTKDRDVLQSDTVQEEISSNIAGYFYRVVDDPTLPNFKADVEAKKDAYGRIAESEFDLYVAPNDNSVSYPTASSFTVNKSQDYEKYVHVIAVDRMSNVSEVKTIKVKDLVQNVDFEVERTADKSKLVDLSLSDSINESMETMEIQVPKNVALEDFTSLLPSNWTSSLDTAPSNHNSYYFKIKDNNSKDVISNFLRGLIFSISNPVDQSGKINVTFHKKENAVGPNDLCWNSEIPQKISLKAYDEDGTTAITSGDILYDQKLRIGQTINVTPKSLDFYEFIELREQDDTPRGLSYTVSDTYQQGKLIYGLRKATLHVRQVIMGSSDKIVVPTEGYFDIRNLLFTGDTTPPAIDPNYRANLVSASGRFEDNPAFTDIVMNINHLTHDADQVQLSVVVPQFYEYLGYFSTPEIADPGGALHETVENYFPGLPELFRGEINDLDEFWITLYIRPNVDDQGNTKTPQPYSWDYEKNKLGKIKIPETP